MEFARVSHDWIRRFRPFRGFEAKKDKLNFNTRSLLFSTGLHVKILILSRHGDLELFPAIWHAPLAFQERKQTLHASLYCTLCRYRAKGYYVASILRAKCVDLGGNVPAGLIWFWDSFVMCIHESETNDSFLQSLVIRRWESLHNRNS